MEVTLDNLLYALLERKVEINMYLVGGKVMYNVNTQCKSGLEFYHKPNDKTIFCMMLYGDNAEIDLQQDINGVIHDLAIQVRHCMYGRDYIGEPWLNILESLGFIKAERETTTTTTVRLT